MKTTQSKERGQAIVLIALAIVILVSMTGIAIDGGFAFSDRRHAQNAADTAALAGALKKVQLYQGVSLSNLTAAEKLALKLAIEAEAKDAAWRIADKNGFNNDIASNTVHVNIPPENGAYAGDEDFVEVIIESNRDTFFAKVIGVDKMYNRVSAIARAKASYKGSWDQDVSFWSLQPASHTSCSGDFTFGGNVNVEFKDGGIFINSSDADCAFVQDGVCDPERSPFFTKDGTPIPVTIVGGHEGQTAVCENLNVSYIEDPTPLVWPDDIRRLERPEDCGTTHPAPTDHEDGVSAYLWPGHYDTFPPGGGETGPTKDYVMKPGNYCVDGVVKVTGNNTTLEGYNVFIYIEDGGTFDITGGDNLLFAKDPDPPEPDPDIPDPVVQPPYEGPADDPYIGWLIYVDPPTPMPTVHPATNAPDCKIGGGGINRFRGTIYTPYCDLFIGGTSSPYGLEAQFISYTTELVGTADIYFNFSDPLVGEFREDGQVGLSQ